MNTTTHTTTPLTDMPVIDSPLDPEVADGLGDELLLGAAADNKVQRVSTVASRATSVNISGQSRAWTMGGRVD